MRLSALSALLLLSCSSSGDSSSDAGTPSNNFSCGGGSLKGQAHISDPATLGPVVGAKLSAPGCTTAVTDDRGYATAATDPGLLIKLSFGASGYLDEYGEFTVLKDGFLGSTYDFPVSTKSTVFTPWSDANGFILVLVGGDGSDGGPCAMGMGTAVAINGHPEIPAGYLKDALTRDGTLTGTAGSGAVLGPMPPGTYEVVGTKTGCKTVGANDGFFSFATSTTVLAGTVTGHSLQLVHM